MENIQEDFELRNIQFKDAVASRKDRTAWRQSHRHRDDGRERRRRIITCLYYKFGAGAVLRNDV